MPKHNACCHTDIQAVLRAVLRYLETAVAHIDNLLLNTFNFITQHDGILLTHFRMEVLKHSAALTLLDSKDNITFLLKPLDSIFRLTEVAPVNTFLSTKCRLMYFWMRRLGCYATQHDTLYAESITAAEHTSHVIKTSNMVQHHHNRLLVRLPIFSHTHAAHLRYLQLSHVTKVLKLLTKLTFSVDKLVDKLGVIHNKSRKTDLFYPLFTFNKSYKSAFNIKKASYQGSMSGKIINFACYS